MSGQTTNRPTLGRVAIVPWCSHCQAPTAPWLHCERDQDDDFEGPRRCNERRRSRSPLRRDKMGTGDSTPHFPVSPDPLTDHGFWASFPRSPPLRYDPVFLEASLLAEPAVGPRYSLDSGGDDPVSLGQVSSLSRQGSPRRDRPKHRRRPMWSMVLRIYGWAGPL